VDCYLYLFTPPYDENIDQVKYVLGPQLDEMFVISPSILGLQGNRLFLQLVVEEGTNGGGSDADFVPLSPTRRLAASRGTWFGIAKP